MKRKIKSEDLQLGMYVEELDRPWLETPFLFQGFSVERREDLETLRELCEYVYIDDEKIFAPGESGSQPTQGAVNISPEEEEDDSAEALIVVEEAFQQAQVVHTTAKTAFTSLSKQIRLGTVVDVDTVEEALAEMVESIMRNPEALMLLSKLEQHRDDAAAHAINCSILALNYGSYIGLEGERLHELGMAALFHDVGETAVPLKVLKHGGRKTEEEVALFRRHTELGKAMLSKMKGIPPCAIDVAYSHHERVDGKGYPKGIKGDQLSTYSKIVSIVDVYEWVTSGAAGGNALTASEASRYIYRQRDEMFDGDTCEKFIQCLGVYPIGSLVEIARGDVGIVLSIPTGDHLHPRLMLILNDKKQPYHPPRLINLSQFSQNGNSADYAVVKVLPGNAYGINMREYLHRELSL
ncbi:HD-GYP domain-containing protein [Pseudomonadota bacterium]